MTTLPEIERTVRELAAQLGDRSRDDSVPAVAQAPEGVPLAATAGLDPGEAPMALLHACRRRWGVPEGWTKAYCPICGAWPGFAECCGVERMRHLRCLRCGSAWRAHALACVFCGTADHARLGSLVPAAAPASWAVEVCRACRGYLKALTALGPAPPESVLLRDLETVELDIAAAERGYRRPQGTGYPFGAP